GTELPANQTEYLARSEPVHEQVQAQPDHVNKVPVPCSPFKTEVVGRGKVAFIDTQPDDEQDQGTHANVETVKTRQQIKGGTVNPGAEFQVQLGIRMHVLIALAADERDAQHDRNGQPERAFASLVSQQRMV